MTKAAGSATTGWVEQLKRWVRPALVVLTVGTLAAGRSRLVGRVVPGGRQVLGGGNNDRHRAGMGLVLAALRRRHAGIDPSRSCLSSAPCWCMNIAGR
ncbi:hypothetical protein EJ571_00725 [Mycobacteroides franklinii]|uniref:Uncharacterized protein n=1 Tax=Mycobacteroides franklinii TaxID=948102 RepID=A0A4R5PHS4_9MYCO|nr:hypothetical protein EJ571_00725 [Mycobacteroides franklinii]